MQSSETGNTRKRKYRPDRLEYLDQLVVEFQTTKSKDAKEQVLANLANFAYDPGNFEFFRELKILDLFLDNLSGPEVLIKFSIGGLCNLCLDHSNKEYIIENGIKKIKSLLEHGNEDVMLSVITSLMFLVTPESKAEITSNDIVKSMVKISKSSNRRLANLATVFLEDYCTPEQIENTTSSDISNIPLPNS